MELGQKLGRGLENARTGVNQLLQDERGGARFSIKKALMYGGLSVIGFGPPLASMLYPEYPLQAPGLAIVIGLLGVGAIFIIRSGALRE